MNKISSKIFWPILAIVLIIIFTPIFGYLYKSIFGPVSAGFFWGPAHPENLSGFLIALSFFIPLFITFSSKRDKNKVILLIIGLLIFIDIGLKIGDDLIIDTIFAIFGWLLGEAILRLYKYSTKK